MSAVVAAGGRPGPVAHRVFTAVSASSPKVPAHTNSPGRNCVTSLRRSRSYSLCVSITPKSRSTRMPPT